MLNMISYVSLVSPRSVHGTIEQFGFKVGEEGIISVQIQANPKPRLTWTVDREMFTEGHMDATQRFEATSATGMVCVLPFPLKCRLPTCFILRVVSGL
jgi:hypothetical protein